MINVATITANTKMCSRLNFICFSLPFRYITLYNIRFRLWVLYERVVYVWSWKSDHHPTRYRALTFFGKRKQREDRLKKRLHDLIYWYYWLVVDWLVFGDLFCQAKNMKRNGMVMTAVVIRIGWNDVGSTLIPKSCKKGSGKTVYIQKPTRFPKINLFRFKTKLC